MHLDVIHPEPSCGPSLPAEHIIGLGSKEQSWDTKPTLHRTLYKDFSQWELATFPWASQMLEKGARISMATGCILLTLAVCHSPHMSVTPGALNFKANNVWWTKMEVGLCWGQTSWSRECTANTPEERHCEVKVTQRNPLVWLRHHLQIGSCQLSSCLVTRKLKGIVSQVWLCPCLAAFIWRAQSFIYVRWLSFTVALWGSDSGETEAALGNS